MLQLPFVGISGDVIIQEPTSTAVSDVFRIFNDLVDTGGGTGLGTLAFLYSQDDGILPSPSTYSINAVTIKEAAIGQTVFVGNGTSYTLLTNVPEPSTFALSLLAASLLVMRVQSKRGRAKTATAAAVVITFSGIPAARAQDVPAVDPLPVGTYRNAFGRGPAQTDTGTLATGLSFYTARYTSLGTSVSLPMNIVGTDPSHGAATTTVPTVIVPIKVVYQAAGGLSLDGTTVAVATQNSPIFLSADYTADGTDLGVTQYGDAVQRAQFWQLPGFSTNYHVLLGTPTIAPTVTVTVTGATQGNLYRLRSGQLLGVVASGFFDPIVNTLAQSFTADTLPIFLTDNVFEGDDGTISTCCVLGYHNSQGPPAITARTWIYAAYTEAGTFTGDVILDVQPLSHEVAEWLNDPFVGFFGGGLNVIPPAILPGTGGACIINFETGDPLEAPPVVFTKTTNGKVYHLQDEVFLTWYLHTVPSFSVNGWYTLQNTFKTFSTLCGPG